MKIKLSAVGVLNRAHVISWPEDWPVPRVGDEIDLPQLPEVSHIRNVVWYPQGDGDKDFEPFVYVVVGPPRRN